MLLQKPLVWIAQEQDTYYRSLPWQNPLIIKIPIHFCFNLFASTVCHSHRIYCLITILKTMETRSSPRCDKTHLDHYLALQNKCTSTNNKQLSHSQDLFTSYQNRRIKQRWISQANSKCRIITKICNKGKNTFELAPRSFWMCTGIIYRAYLPHYYIINAQTAGIIIKSFYVKGYNFQADISMHFQCYFLEMLTSSI